LKKRLPSLESVGNLSGVPGAEYFSTGRSFTAFGGNVETIVAYEFFNDRLAKIAFIIHGGDSLGAMSAVVEALNHEFGRYALDDEGGKPVYLWGYKDFGIYAKDPLGPAEGKVIEFLYYPLVDQYP
jgi:hypothetical protein